MVYKASLDKLAIGITIFTVILFIALPVYFATSVEDKNPLVIILVTELVLIAAWAYHPTQYSINGTHMVIHRPIKNLLIARNKIEAAFEIPNEDISYSIRVFGAGGFFGYFENLRIKNWGV